MATLFHNDTTRWIPRPITCPEGTAVPSMRAGTGDEFPDRLLADTTILKAGTARDDAPWVLLAPSDGRVRVNGEPVPAGMRVLVHQDALSLEGGRVMFFSEEEPARVEPAAQSGPECPRCLDVIQPGSLSVRCPGCGLVHHQTPESPCWTYAPRCAGCGYPSVLGGDDAWTPDALPQFGTP